MVKNQTYIQNLEIDKVPWGKISTAYGRATKFPKYFDTLWNMTDMAMVKTALYEVSSSIEHQSTLWHSTPFAIIFLTRIFEHAMSERNTNEIATYIIEQLLDFFCVIAQCFHDVDKIEHPEPLPDFSDMLKEEYLWSEEYDEEEDETWYEEFEEYPDDLFYSFYYYSYQTLLLCKPILEQLENPSFYEAVKELQELL